MIGIMHKHQKAVLFYDPFGRAGKGTLERIMRGLVPSSFVTAVSPFGWDKEYYVASLAGARLNVVGELSDDKPIPAAMFKTVTGVDLITGRFSSTFTTKVNADSLVKISIVYIGIFMPRVTLHKFPLLVFLTIKK